METKAQVTAAQVLAQIQILILAQAAAGAKTQELAELVAAMTARQLAEEKAQMLDPAPEVPAALEIPEAVVVHEDS